MGLILSLVTRELGTALNPLNIQYLRVWPCITSDQSITSTSFFDILKTLKPIDWWEFHCYLTEKRWCIAAMEVKHTRHNRRYRQDVKMSTYMLLKYTLNIYLGRWNTQRPKFELPDCRKEYSCKNQPKYAISFNEDKKEDNLIPCHLWIIALCPKAVGFKS